LTHKLLYPYTHKRELLFFKEKGGNKMGKDQLDMDQLILKALDLQKKKGVVQALETTRASVLDLEYLKRNQEAGVIAINITLAAPEASKCDTPESWSFQRTVGSIDDWYRAVHELPDPNIAHIPVLSVKDILECRRQGKVGIIFGLQGGGYWFDKEFLLLRTAYRLGVRIVGVSYQMRTIYTDGVAEGTNVGISQAGRKLVKELNEIGAVIDLSHTGERSALEIIELSSDPVIFSHSGVRAIGPIAENVSDVQIDAIEKNGGVIGIPAFSPDLMRDPSNPTWPTVDDFVEHIDYIVQKVGVDHVGYGLDYAYRRKQEDQDTHNVKYGGFLPHLLVETTQIQGLQGPNEIGNATSRLLKLGYSEEDIGKILSGNFLRVFKEVWGE
jgi:membrane dipeptidase